MRPGIGGDPWSPAGRPGGVGRAAGDSGSLRGGRSTCPGSGDAGHGRAGLNPRTACGRDAGGTSEVPPHAEELQSPAQAGAN